MSGPHVDGDAHGYVGHDAAVVEAAPVVVDPWIDAGDGGAGQQGRQERAVADRVGASRGDVHGDGGERHDQVVERAIPAAEELLDHGGADDPVPGAARWDAIEGDANQASLNLL